MINQILLIALVLLPLYASAQKKAKIENEIRYLEQLAVGARMAGDSNLLRNLWAPEFMVTTPANKIMTGKEAAIQNQNQNNFNYISFKRVIEKILVRKNLAISMGNEVFITREDHTQFKAGDTVKRRFTHVWMFQKGKWQLIARHGSITCAL